MPKAVLLVLLLWLGSLTPVSSQESEMVQGMAGLHPLRAWISPAPVRLGRSRVRVEVGPVREGPPIAVEGVQLLVDMPSMPRQRPFRTPLVRRPDGFYEGDLVLTMRGIWRVQFLVKTPTGEFRVVTRVPLEAAATPVADPNREFCGPEDQGEAPEVKVRLLGNGPARLGDNRLRIESATPARRVYVGVELTGVAMSVPPREARPRKDGSHEVEVSFPMAGVWQVRVDLDGRVSSPSVFVVDPPAAPRAQRRLWMLVGWLALPLGVWAWRKGRSPGPVALGWAMCFTTLGLAVALERFWPSPPEMLMDMARPDLGLDVLSAPMPVQLARVQRLKLGLRRTFPGSIEAEKAQLLRSAHQGAVLEVATPGQRIGRGQPVVRLEGGWIKSSLAGAVLRALVEPGQVVQPGQALLEVAELDRVKVRARVPLRYRNLLAVGADLRVRDDMSSTRTRIRSLAAVAEGETCWLEAGIDNDQPGGSLGHGDRPARPNPPGQPPLLFALQQRVEVECLLEEVEGALCVPRQAMRFEPERTSVLVVESVAGQKLVRRRSVTPGLQTPDMIQVLSGLQEGEQVVALCEPGLREGMVVTAARWEEGSSGGLLMPEEFMVEP